MIHTRSTPRSIRWVSWRTPRVVLAVAWMTLWTMEGGLLSWATPRTTWSTPRTTWWAMRRNQRVMMVLCMVVVAIPVMLVAVNISLFAIKNSNMFQRSPHKIGWGITVVWRTDSAKDNDNGESGTSKDCTFLQKFVAWGWRRVLPNNDVRDVAGAGCHFLRHRLEFLLWNKTRTNKI